MSKYTYLTATTPVEIDIDNYWLTLLMQEDIKERNSLRRHMRSDHKYARGMPISFDSLSFQGEWFIDLNNEINVSEILMDLEHALFSLTKLQRKYFILIRLRDFKNVEIAKREGKDESTIREIVKNAEKKILNILK